MKKIKIISLLIDYMRQRDMWALLPIMMVVGLLAVVSAMVQVSPLFLPFIYAGF